MDHIGRQPVILVGISGSAASLAALSWAAGETRRRASRLRVIQAWQVHPARAPYAGTGYGQQRLASAVTAADHLAAVVRSTLGIPAGSGHADLSPSGLRGGDVSTEVIEGTAERVLAEASAEADLLVLGSGGQSPVAYIDPLIVDRPIGPVIRACLSHARCPVVIIGQSMTAEPGLRAVRPAARAAVSARV